MSINKLGGNIDRQIKIPIKPAKTEEKSLEPKDTVERSVKVKDVGLIPKHSKKAWTSGAYLSAFDALVKGVVAIAGGGIVGAIAGGFAGASMGGPIGSVVGVILGIPLGGVAGFGTAALLSK